MSSLLGFSLNFCSVAILLAIFTASCQAFSPRGFLKREDPALQKAAAALPAAQPQEKRFDLDNFYGGAAAQQQMKRFELPEAFYEHFPQQKRFDYLDGFYGAPATSGFYPFYGPPKRFDYGYGPRGHPLSAFL